MWPATERAAQRRAAQHAGVGGVGALAKAWGWGVQARLQGSWRRTGGQTGLQDTQPADRQPTSGCLSLLSLLFVPNICMLTYIHVHTIYICTHISLYPYLHKYTHTYLNTNIHTCLHTYIFATQ